MYMLKAFKGKLKIQDHCEKTIYKVKEQPSTGMLVFRISPVDQDGKVKIVQCNLVIPSGTNIEMYRNKGD